MSWGGAALDGWTRKEVTAKLRRWQSGKDVGEEDSGLRSSKCKGPETQE